ncbi:uncharacterized protein BP01DRAFT_380967 [Aspergillus saccharolyticus JOP 1030-1]|uniref:C2H2-type domain-containing protein n=1 Tax=Aspergillus saccharolyticus JOP 1030-1 TaxID=1450539 RepID=A0A319AKI0_9EURO|nr:hypothetical protein BP01DRAFT_380967 [Aspergillus saccharolyticus JOP 1030-1]PYH47122.1 hypothetical protein BP01DRAFT_380967 [Aspergillus saccharolyticus JOP 1030-1]
MTQPAVTESEVKLECPHEHQSYLYQVPDQTQHQLQHQHQLQLQLQLLNPYTTPEPVLLSPTSASTNLADGHALHRTPSNYCHMRDRIYCTVITDGKRCGRHFETMNALARHHQKLHDNLTDPCPFCGRRFYGRFSWGLHMEKEHGISQPGGVNIHEQEGCEEKGFQLLAYGASGDVLGA